jgi:hypothetical protein
LAKERRLLIEAATVRKERSNESPRTGDATEGPSVSVILCFELMVVGSPGQVGMSILNFR